MEDRLAADRCLLCRGPRGTADFLNFNRGFCAVCREVQSDNLQSHDEVSGVFDWSEPAESLDSGNHRLSPWYSSFQHDEGEQENSEQSESESTEHKDWDRLLQMAADRQREIDDVMQQTAVANETLKRSYSESRIAVEQNARILARYVHEAKNSVLHSIESASRKCRKQVGNLNGSLRQMKERLGRLMDKSSTRVLSLHALMESQIEELDEVLSKAKTTLVESTELSLLPVDHTQAIDILSPLIGSLPSGRSWETQWEPTPIGPSSRRSSESSSSRRSSECNRFIIETLSYMPRAPKFYEFSPPEREIVNNNLAVSTSKAANHSPLNVMPQPLNSDVATPMFEAWKSSDLTPMNTQAMMPRAGPNAIVSPSAVNVIPQLLHSNFAMPMHQQPQPFYPNMAFAQQMNPTVVMPMQPMWNAGSTTLEQVPQPMMPMPQQIDSYFDSIQQEKAEEEETSSSNRRGSRIRRPTMYYAWKIGDYGTMEGQFTEPSGVAVTPRGEIVVADTNNHRIQVFNQAGYFRFQFGGRGLLPGQLLYPSRVAMNPATGDFVIIERSPTRQVQIFDCYGRFITKFGSNVLRHPRGVCVDNRSRVIVLECKVKRVVVFDYAGNVLNRFTRFDHLEFPNSVCTNNQEILVCDNRGHCVKVFSYDGSFLRSIGGEGLTNYPIAVCINSIGEVVISDNHNNFNVTVFDQDGNFIKAYESKVKHAQGYDATLLGDEAVIFSSKDYRLYLYRFPPPTAEEEPE